ncbi:MAG: glycosyltransferase family 2 protein [Rickettsiales bacterium]
MGELSACMEGAAAKGAAEKTFRLPISCFVIAKNEADRLPFTLESVKGWVGEMIVVVDPASADDTADVAARMGAKTITHAWEGYGPQKCYAESLCNFPWILNLDADESVSPPLRDETIDLFERYAMRPPFDGFRLSVVTLRPGENAPSFLAPSNSPVRLYRAEKGGFKNSPVHDSVAFDAPSPVIGKLRGKVHHRSFRSYFHAVEKINSYSTMQAEDIVRRKKTRFVCVRLALEPFTAFLKAYFLRRYMFMGVDGVAESLLYAFARTLRWAKVRELQKKQRHGGDS